MAKSTRKESIFGAEKACILTGSRVNLDCHHCFHGIRRKAADEWGCWVWLRHDLHMELHDRNKDLDRYIQRLCQKRFETLYGHETFMRVFGKNYL